MSFVETLLTEDHNLNQQLISFLLHGKKYTGEMLSVQTVRRCDAPINIPHVPVYIRGSIKVGGWVAPVLDIHQYCGQKPRALDTHKVAVIRLPEASCVELIGAVNKSFSNHKPDEQEEPNKPAALIKITSAFVVGIAIVEDLMVVLMNAERLIDAGLMSE